MKLQEKSAQQLEKIADRWFSWYVRLDFADMDGNCKCCTCGKVKPWKQMDNGHYVSRDRNATRYHFRNCAPQCRWCNSYKHGMKEEHARFIDAKYGAGTAEDLKNLDAMPSKALSRDYYLLIISDFKAGVKLMEKEKGLRVNES